MVVVEESVHLAWQAFFGHLFAVDAYCVESLDDHSLEEYLKQM